MPVDVTFLGHAGFLLRGANHAVAIDPFLTGNPVATLAPGDITCDAVALTHGHEDHFGDTLEIAKANDAEVFGAFELCTFCEDEGHAKVQPMNPGGRVDTDFGFVALTHAFHSSSYKGRYMGMPCGVIVEIDGTTFYHCGDTGLFGDMKLIGELYEPDVTMVPIGDRFTMGPALATRAAELIGAKIAIPVHYGTWPPIAQDPADFRPAGVTVKVMQPGESATL